MAESVNYRFTDHALFEMKRRGISEQEVLAVLAAPEKSEAVRPGRSVFQLRISRGDPPKDFLLRVFVDVDRHPKDIVTVYLTSKIAKYWREET